MSPSPGDVAVVYVLADFPIASEQFVERELAGLWRQGMRFRVLALNAGPRRGARATGPQVPWEVCYRPSWYSPRLWLGASLAALAHPLASTRLLRLAWEAGVREGRLPGSLRLLVLALHEARRVRRNGPAVLHAHFATAPATFTLLLASCCGLPWGFSSHAADVYTGKADLEWKSGRANHVVACSRILAEHLRKRLSPAGRSRVHMVHHGLDLEDWRPLHRPADAEDRPLILGVGRWVPKKGFDVLIEACSLLRRAGLCFRCELIGAGPDRSSLERRIRERDLEGWVSLLPWCSPHELRQRFARASAVAVPSVIAADGDRDNIPNVLIEALACEIPVVASALPALEDLLAAAGAALLVPPQDSHALAEALYRVCTSPEVTQDLCRSGRRLVEERFDRDRNARRLQDVLERSAGEGPVCSRRSASLSP